MKRSRLTLLFALAVIGPGAVLGWLGFRSLRAEEIIRSQEIRDQARGVLKLAAHDVEADLAAWLTAERVRLEKDPNAPEFVLLPPAPPPPLEARVARERPDLLAMLDRAEEKEFREHAPAEAMALYLAMAAGLENRASRGLLTYAAARCAPDPKPLWEEIVRDYGDIIGESLVPLGVTARLKLGLPDSTPLDPATELLLHRDEPRARLRLKALEATTFPAWLPGGVAIRIGDRIAALHLPELKTAKLRDLAKLSGLELSVGGGGDIEEPIAGGTLKLTARVESKTTGSGRMLQLGAFTGLLILVMSAGFLFTLRSVNREVQLNRLKSDFISNVSHEVRTPLTSIRMFSELISNPAVADRRDEYAALIRQESERLSALVERILDVARLERGAVPFEFQVLDLGTVVDGAVRSFHPSRPEFRFTLKRPATPVRTRLDPRAFDQVVHNLLENAVKYSPDQVEAEVEITTENDRAVLAIRDRGIGIDPRDVPQVFETFFRGSHPMTQKTPGAGLGLAIVRQIVKAHRGSVAVESAPGAGTTFKVELPLCLES